MTESERVRLFLRDMLAAAERAEAFVAELELDEFAADEKTLYATVRALEIIGEAAKQIPDDVRQQASELPWRDMARMRDRLIHHYFSVDAEVVWKTVKNDLPTLRSAVNRLLAQGQS